MSDVFKLQYNGMTLAYPGWNGYVGWENAEVAYNLYLQQQTGGTITADKLSGMNGEIVTLSNTPDAGYQFNSYGITGAELSGNQFAFDGSDVTAHANFEEAIYTLTLQNDGHGTIAASKTTGHAGDTVTLSNTYNTYYRFNNYTVTGGTINGSTFTFGSQNATAKANFKVNSFTATGTFANYNLAPLGRNTLNYLFYPIVKAKQSNVPASWLTTKTSYAKTISAYNSSYKTTASGSNASAFKPTGTISAYQFSGYLQTCAYSDYDTSRWHSCNYGLWAGGSKRVNGTPTTPSVAKAYFMTTTNGTTNVTGDVFWSGGLTGTRAADNITICNGVTTNKWRASGILP